MKGKMVPRKAGWDTHGLPVELEVEKLLGLDGKEQIEEYGLDPFIKKCKESVWKYKGMGRFFPKPLVSGQIWIIRMLPMMIILLSPNGGH